MSRRPLIRAGRTIVDRPGPRILPTTLRALTLWERTLRQHGGRTGYGGYRETSW